MCVCDCVSVCVRAVSEQTYSGICQSSDKETRRQCRRFLGTTRSDDRTERDTPTKDTIDDDH